MNCTFTGMNFLAHAYLSFGHPQILVGNMVSDFVKGAKKNLYRNDIRQGIMLHRDIDSFTDTHFATLEAKEVFRPAYRLYSGPIVDIVFDHFLAIDIENNHDGGVDSFARWVYETLEAHSMELPENFLPVLHYMKLHNWLGNYLHREGIERSLRGLVNRARYINDSNTAVQLFNDHHEKLGLQFHQFFPDVKEYAKQKLEQLLG